MVANRPESVALTRNSNIYRFLETSAGRVFCDLVKCFHFLGKELRSRERKEIAQGHTVNQQPYFVSSASPVALETP